MKDSLIKIADITVSYRKYHRFSISLLSVMSLPILVHCSSSILYFPLIRLEPLASRLKLPSPAEFQSFIFMRYRDVYRFNGNFTEIPYFYPHRKLNS